MAETAKLGYGEVGNIGTAVSEGILDARDIVITEDSSEFVYIRDDGSQQFIRTRDRLFESESAALTALNADTDTHAGQTVMIMDDDGKYVPYIVQYGDTSFVVEPITVSVDVGLTWQKF